MYRSNRDRCCKYVTCKVSVCYSFNTQKSIAGKVRNIQFVVLSTKITTARIGGGFFVFAPFTLLSFFLAHYRQDFVNSLWTIINILWTCLQGQLIVDYAVPFSVPHVYSGYIHVVMSVSCFSTLQSCNVVVTILGLIVLYYSIQAKLSIYYFLIIQYKNILANTQL